MTKYLYRFRAIDNLLEKHAELERQEVYFASAKELNDPMEGFDNVFWSGDKIVWTNFIKNYLLCLLNVSYLFLIFDKNKNKIEDDHIFRFKTLDHLPTPQYKRKYNEICYLFFSDMKAKRYLEWLPSQDKSIKRDELIYYLKSLHFHALNCIFAKIAPSLNNNLIRKLASELTIDFENFNVNEIIKNSTNIELDLCTLYNNQALLEDNNIAFLLLYFPEKYITQLKYNLMNFDWYTACFLSEKGYKNPSMWAYYGNNHTGVCLKFRIQSDSAGSPFMKLRGINGNRNDVELNYHFHEVKYEKIDTEINFFHTIGRLSISDLRKYWYRDENGNKSIIEDTVWNNNKKYREEYWNNIIDSQTSKLKGWSHEGEERLILQSLGISDFSNPNNRKFKYNFSDLDGIIFGINTHIQDKIKIIKIVNRKCKIEGRTDFNFYQAYYSRKTGEIERRKLDLSGLSKNLNI